MHSFQLWLSVVLASSLLPFLAIAMVQETVHIQGQYISRGLSDDAQEALDSPGTRHGLMMPTFYEHKKRLRMQTAYDKRKLVWLPTVYHKKEHKKKHLVADAGVSVLVSGVASHASASAVKSNKKKHLIVDAGVSVIVPGVGSHASASAVKSNVVSFMKNQPIPFDCVIYVYKTKDELPLEDAEFEPCQLVRHVGFWMDHLRAFPLDASQRPYVLHWLDSIHVQHLDVGRMIQILEKNKMAMVSPSFQNGYWDGMRSSEENSGPGGRKLSFVEFQINLFTRDSFHCLQSQILDRDKQIHLGWGVDELFPRICHAEVGVIDDMYMVKWRPSHELYDADRAKDEMADTYQQLGYSGLQPSESIETIGPLEGFLQTLQ